MVSPGQTGMPQSAAAAVPERKRPREGGGKQSKTVVLIAPFDEGEPTPEHFRIETGSVPEPGELREGAILCQILAMSPDPFLRSRMKSNHPSSATRTCIEAGQPVSGYVAGKIIGSKNPKWRIGELFGAYLPFSTVQVVNAGQISKSQFRKLSQVVTEETITHGIGVLGMPGATAYGGLVDILKPKAGETIFVSAAAGAVGGLVGQIAKKVYNCKVIGSAGGPEKCALVVHKYGFDECIDYKTVSSADGLVAEIKKHAPDGIDMYFENVGGIHLDAALKTLRPHGRVAVCGGISNYNKAQSPGNVIDVMQMVYTYQRIEGFVCIPWLTGENAARCKENMHNWVKEGKFVIQETAFDGVESWPTAFQTLFTGKNKGKVVVKIAPEVEKKKKRRDGLTPPPTQA